MTAKKPESLQNFMVKGYRIYDSVTREIISEQTKENE